MSASGLPLLEATRQATEAASAGDLEALHEALEARQKAIEGASPEELAEAFARGEAVAALLRGVKQRLAAENSRLEQIRGILRSRAAASSSQPLVDLRG